MIILDKFLKKKNIYQSNLTNSIKLKKLKFLTNFHYSKCKEYKKILDSELINPDTINSISQLPYLPSDLFKRYNIQSIPKKKIYKTLKSSGTSSQIPSKIILDRETSNLQSKVLIKIVNSLTKKDRMPMIIIDTPNIFKNKESYSARAAGVLGFSIFSTEKLFIFDNNMNIDFKNLKIFLNKYKNETILLFGFTYIIWKFFFKKIIKTNIDLSKCILIHGGGWKKIKDEKISNSEFKNKLSKKFNLKQIFNYYGMVEQTGSIFVECKEGYFHTSLFNDIIIRDVATLKIKDINKPGVVQTLSLLPISYPGHSILTEDIGIIKGLDNCKCGIKGKYFEILGRLEKAEIRGCSDTYE